MNFLLHHQWALRETGDPVLAAASMLPDLWRMVHRRARLGSRLFRVPDANDSVARGLEHHLTTDRWFHDAPMFTDGESRTVRAIQGAGVQADKMILFAHPLWELCLDGALVRRRGLASVLGWLGEAHRAVGVEVAEACGLERLLPDVAERAQFATRLDSLWDALEEGRWVEAYTTPAGLTECMSRMRERVGFTPLAADDRARLEAAIATLEPHADAALGDL